MDVLAFLSSRFEALCSKMGDFLNVLIYLESPISSRRLLFSGTDPSSRDFTSLRSKVVKSKRPDCATFTALHNLYGVDLLLMKTLGTLRSFLDLRPLRFVIFLESETGGVSGDSSGCVCVCYCLVCGCEGKCGSD